MARPTKYSEKILEKTKDYLKDYKSENDVIPSIEGLASYINIRRSTIYEWAKQEDKAEFADTLDDIQALQKRTLLNNGLTGDFNSNIVKLALGNHGMSDKQTTNHAGALGVIDLSGKTDEELKSIINGTASS